MSSFLDTLELGVAAVKSNPVVEQYAEPIALAVLTGSGTITIPQGQIKISQAGAPAKFTFGTALVALETFLLTNDTSIQIGTTVVEYIPKASPAPVAA